MTTVNQQNNYEKTGRSAQNILALALAALGMKVFICRHVDEYRNGELYRKAKTPLTLNGFQDATTDPATIDAWWAEFPNALVGWLPVSVECAVLDLDNKNGKDGIYELETRELEFLSTLWYRTPSGGQHHVFREPWARKVGPQQDYLGFPGVDIRSGGSYAIWYGEAPTSLEDIPEMPEWIRQGKRKSRKRGSASGPRVVNGQRNYEGETDQWFDWLGYDNPWWTAVRIEEEVNAMYHVGHGDLLRLLWWIHQERLKGTLGLGPVALLVVDRFRSTTNNENGWERELDDAIRGAIGPDWTPDAQPETIAAAGGDDIA